MGNNKIEDLQKVKIALQKLCRQLNHDDITVTKVESVYGGIKIQYIRYNLKHEIALELMPVKIIEKTS